MERLKVVFLEAMQVCLPAMQMCLKPIIEMLVNLESEGWYIGNLISCGQVLRLSTMYTHS